MTHAAKRKIAPGLWQLKTDLFEIRVRVQHPRTGKLIARWRKFEGSRKEAMIAREAWRDELLVELEGPQQRETIASYAASWMRMKLDRGDIAPSTAQKYAIALDVHIIPGLGNVLIDELTTRDVNQWFTKMARSLRPASCNGYRRALVTMLNDARADGLVVQNVADVVKPIKERPTSENSMTAAELRQYLAKWEEMHPYFYPLILVLALTGVRWGEATVLQWSEIEEAEATGLLAIKRSHWRGHVKEPKTGKVRFVPYPTVLAKAMKEHRRQIVADQHPSLKGGLCFSASNGALLTHGRLYAKNRVVLTNAGIAKRVTIHGLRRTVTDLLRIAQVDHVTAAALIGHDSDRMRKHYSTVRADEARDAGDRVVQLVVNAGQNGRSSGRSESDGVPGQRGTREIGTGPRAPEVAETPTVSATS